MGTGEIIGTFILLAIAIGAFTISAFQFREKGLLFNNAYLYASQRERERMDKKPYYRQSAIGFLFLGVIFLLNAVNIMLKTNWLFYIIMVLVVLVVIYAIVSSIRIDS